MILLIMIHRIDLKFKLHEFHNFWTFRSNILYISDLFTSLAWKYRGKLQAHLIKNPLVARSSIQRQCAHRYRFIKLISRIRLGIGLNKSDLGALPTTLDIDRTKASRKGPTAHKWPSREPACRSDLLDQRQERVTRCRKRSLWCRVRSPIYVGPLLFEFIDVEYCPVTPEEEGEERGYARTRGRG